MSNEEQPPRGVKQYVHLIGPAEIQCSEAGFTVRFLTSEAKPISGIEPLVFEGINTIKLLNVHFIAEMSEEELTKRKGSFKTEFTSVRSLVEAQTNATIIPAEESPFHPFMNPTDPPPKGIRPITSDEPNSNS